MIISGWYEFLGKKVIGDDNGIYWRKAHVFWPKRYTLPWQDVQGFFVVRFEGSSKLVKEKAFLTYIINSDHATLVWTINATSHGTTRAATDMLSRLVVTYTRQPLRDLTEAATDILLASNT